MTIDKEKLKALAEAMLRDEQGAELSGEEVRGFPEAVRSYEAMTAPSAVLALLAEIERLTKFEDWFVRLDQVEQSLAASFKAERDQLKAENEDYKSGQERYEQIIEDLKAENEALRRDSERYRGVRRVANHQGFTDEQFDQQTDSRVSRFDAAMAKEANHDR